MENLLILTITFLAGIILAAIAGAPALVTFLRRANSDEQIIVAMEKGYNTSNAAQQQAIKIVANLLPIVAMANPTEDLKQAALEASRFISEISDGVPYASKLDTTEALHSAGSTLANLEPEPDA